MNRHEAKVFPKLFLPEDYHGIRFSDESRGLILFPEGLDSHKDDADAHFLRLDHSLAKVLVASQQIGRADRPILGEAHQIANDQGVNAFLNDALSPWNSAPQSQLYPWLSRYGVVGLGWNGISCAVVPVGPHVTLARGPCRS